MAHKKAGGSSRNGRDSAGQRLGIKIFGGEAGASPATSSRASAAPSGMPGATSALAGTTRLFALINGHVEFQYQNQRPRIRIGTSDDGGRGPVIRWII